MANATTKDLFAGGERNPAVALTEGFQDAFLVCGAFAVLGAVLAALSISGKDSRKHAQAARRGEVEVAPAV